MPEDGQNDEGVDFAEDAAGAEDLEEDSARGGADCAAKPSN